jgi:hypothetical protein
MRATPRRGLPRNRLQRCLRAAGQLLRPAIHGLSIAFVISVAVATAAQAEGDADPAKPEPLTKGPAPRWVDDVSWSIPDGAPPAGVGAQVLLSDGQDQLTTHGSDYYFRLVVRLLSTDAVKRYAQQTNELSPDFERVTWHTLVVHRGDQTLDRLAAAKFTKLQRELGLEGQMLTGEVTYSTVLDDIRVGDVLETAFTTHYENPLFAGQLTARHDLGSAYPVQHERVVIHLPESGPEVRPSLLVPDGIAGLPDPLYRLPELEAALTDNSKTPARTYVWEGRKLPAIPFDDNLPGTAYPYWPQLRVSSYTTWSDVVRWAEPLFTTPEKLPEPLPGLIEKWKQLGAPEQRLAAAVHWVQDDIRYFALELGEHTLRPRPLADVCSTRYGDCKDKALLLATVLRALGFDAWPALVNTYWRDRLHVVRPDPHAFNHAVVAYQFRGTLHWVDATLSKQKGRPGEWAFPPLRTALIIRPGENDLVDVNAQPPREPIVTTVDRIKPETDSADAIMETETTIRGIDADFYRQKLDTVSASDRSKYMFNFIARFYRHLEEIDAPAVQDDPDANVVTLRAKYRIHDFVRNDGGQPGVGVYAYALRSVLDVPESRRRHWPYALPSDRFVRHRIEVELPFEVEVAQLPQVIKTDGIEFRAECGLAGRRLVAQYDLRVTADYVPANDMGQFCDNAEEILNAIGVVVHQPPSKKASTALTDPSARDVAAKP